MTSEWESEIVEVVARAVREEWGPASVKRREREKILLQEADGFSLK